MSPESIPPSLEAPIAVSIQYEEEDLVRAVRLHGRGANFSLVKGCAYAAVVSAVGVYFVMTNDTVSWFGLLAIAFGVVATAFFLWVYFITPRRLARQEAGPRVMNHVIFSDAGVEARSDGAESKAPWTLYTRVVADAHTYLLYHGQHDFIAIPTRVFSSPAEQAAFERLLERQNRTITRKP